MEQHLQTIRNQFESNIKKITENLARRADDGGKLSISKMDENQLVHYNLAYHTAEFNIADYFLNYAQQNGDMEKDMASAFLGEAFNRFRGELAGRAEEYGLSPADISGLFTQDLNDAIQKSVDKGIYDRVAEKVIAGEYGNVGADDYAEIRDLYRKIAEQTVMPHAEHVHRHDDFIPEDILNELINNGAFGLSIPEQYGGLLDMLGNVGMMIVTEELSRGGLSIAGSLITRPEILSKAIIKGGTDAQKEKWLTALASGERMAGVAVTEPNFGSDVAGMKVTADKVDGGWVINGVKTWCTFAGYADVLLVLARTEKDPALKHKGLSILLAEKPRSKDHKFEVQQEGGGSMSGSAIATIGYRGMHSFEVNFDNYFVPDENLIGGEEGRGKGFYLQMAGFAGGRVQTAARANGVMQAAMEAAARYANERKVFGKELKEYQINRWKLAKMAMIVQASRQYSYHVAGLMDEGKGNMEATLVKFYASRISEWVTREAMQIHGGAGISQDYPLASMWTNLRTLRFADGPDAVHRRQIARAELRKYTNEKR